jgi:hypothetical protein
VGAGLEQVRDADEVVQHGHVGGAVDGGEQGGIREDGPGLGGDGAGGGFEDQVIGDGGGLVLDDQGAGQGVDVLVEGDLGLAAGGVEPAQRRVGGQGVGGGAAAVWWVVRPQPASRATVASAPAMLVSFMSSSGLAAAFGLVGSACVAGVAAPFAGQLQAGSSAND